MAEVDPALEQQIFDLSQRQRITDIHHDREADDLGRTVEITERIVHHLRLRDLTFQLKPIYSDNAACSRSTNASLGGACSACEGQQGIDEGEMPKTLLDLDSPSSWPAELRTYLDEHHELFLAWETKPGRVSSEAFDKALYGLRDILQAYEILGWHCTRLTDAEVDEIMRDGMELPNAEMLTRRIDALVKANVIDPDVARRFKSKNEAGEEYRAGMVWFCFILQGTKVSMGSGGSSATGVARLYTRATRMIQSCPPS